jgi:lipopolysaccharide export system permease protein
MKKLIFKKLARDINVFFFITIICISSVIWVIQAVNFLDIVSQDGHSFKVYFLYTLFSLPKIISKILPFIFLITLINIIIKYELNNELVIFWLTGINKLKFVNNILKVSIFYFLIQLILTTLLVPYTLDKGRSFFRDSNVDLFASIIKEKKFIDTVENLTIFVEKKNGSDLEKIMLKDKISDNEFQIIVAERGKIFTSDNSKKIILINGKIINHLNKDQNIISFSEFTFDLSKYATNTIIHQKTQEMNSMNLVNCIKKINLYLKKVSPKDQYFTFFSGCNTKIEIPLKEELFKRFYSPIYIILVALISSLIIMNNKDKKNYASINSFIFLMGVVVIILSEISLGYASISLTNTLIYISAPVLIFSLIYIYLIIHNKMNS